VIFQDVTAPRIVVTHEDGWHGASLIMAWSNLSTRCSSSGWWADATGRARTLTAQSRVKSKVNEQAYSRGRGGRYGNMSL